MLVQVDSLTIPQTVVGGEGFWLMSLVGWRGVSDSKISGDERPRAHGKYAWAADYRTSVKPSVTFGFTSASYANVLSAIDTVSALGDGTQKTVTVTTDIGARSRTVSIRNIEIPDDHGMSAVTFSLDMEAADPRLYGTSTSGSVGTPTQGTGFRWAAVWSPGAAWGSGGTDGRLTLTNQGTADSFPLFEVTGQLDNGFQIVELGTGRTVRFERFVPAGSTIFLNARTGRAYIDAAGNDVSGFLTRFEFPFVPAGGSTVLQFSALTSGAGSPTLTGRVSSAWW